MSTLTPQEFVDKWRHATLKEKSAAQEHFIDLCHLIGHATPAEADSTGESFALEVGAEKLAILSKTGEEREAYESEVEVRRWNVCCGSGEPMTLPRQ